MLVRGLVEVDQDQFGALRPMALADPILRGKEQVLFRRDRSTAASANLLKKKNERIALDPEATALFDALRGERTRLAREQGVPAYVIFHDTTLAAIATARPMSLDALAEIPGMGRTKVERYGAVVIATVAAS